MNKTEQIIDAMLTPLGRLAAQSCLGVLPAKDCAKCQYRQPGWCDGGHCYMFRDEPAGEFCGQFKPLTGDSHAR